MTTFSEVTGFAGDVHHFRLEEGFRSDYEANHGARQLFFVVIAYVFLLFDCTSDDLVGRDISLEQMYPPKTVTYPASLHSR